MNKLKIMLIVCVAILAGCGKQAEFKMSEKSEHSSNKDIVVEKLFTHEGCTVYRFKDYRTHYFSKCQNTSEVMSGQSESCGKNCTKHYDETIKTEYSK